MSIPSSTPPASTVVSSTPSDAGPSNGAIQISTIFAIVIGLGGFVALILAASFISRLSCFNRQIQNLPLRPRLRPLPPYDLRHPNANASRLGPRYPNPHVEPTIFVSLARQPQAYDHPPPYGGPSPPQYAETDAVQAPPQQLTAPPRAMVAV